jgi:tetratricopeptide (TPR) repeat protein
MKKLSLVALTLLFSTCCIAADLNDSLKKIETDWAQVYYAVPGEAQGPALDKLLAQTETLAQRYPDRAEPLIWEAIVVSTRAGVQNGFDALNAIHRARDLLLQAIRLNPRALDGSAFVNLGSLYYLAPSWPVAFGDDEKAEEMFQAALKIKPDSLDANYFYGDFLLSQGKREQAVRHFKTALAAPVRSEQRLADSRLQREAKQALQILQSQKEETLKNVFPALSSIHRDM